MKKIITSTLVVVFSIIFSIAVFADTNVDYGQIYIDFAKDADVNFDNPWHTSTKAKGLMMVDLKGDGVPVIIGYDTQQSVYDENGKTIFHYDQRYNDPKYLHISHKLLFVYGIKNNKVVKYEANGQIYFPLPYLPFEDATEEDKYCGFVVDKNNVRAFVTYNPNYIPKYQAIYPAYGDIKYKDIDLETFKSDYREADFSYAYAQKYDFDTMKSITYEEAVKLLLSNYKKVVGSYEETTPEPEYNVSAWAKDTVLIAEEEGLVPDVLVGKDLTQPITRAEFAALSVRTYECMSEKKILPASDNPFTDTTDNEVLKAYNSDIAVGVSPTEFMPDAFLSREQAAAMLTRVYKKASIANWSLASDSDYELDYVKPVPFADDEFISDWAKDSVYFMVANGIISGIGNNEFAPKNVTPEEEATAYANATREQAILIAFRMIENIK